MRDNHGKSTSSEYKAWNNMLTRCLNINSPNYRFYGGRGIVLCEEWKRFINFYRDMGDKPSPKHTLERRDNDRGYSKDNCYWASTKQQSLNRRSNKLIEYYGVKLTLKEWADWIGVKPVTLASRLRRGDSLDSALDRSLHAGFKR